MNLKDCPKERIALYNIADKLQNIAIHKSTENIEGILPMLDELQEQLKAIKVQLDRKEPTLE